MPNHVSLWRGNLGYVRVEPNDVLAFGLQCPIQPNQRLLRCDICGNFIHFTNVAFGNIVAPYFKHHGTATTYTVNGQIRICPNAVQAWPPPAPSPPPNPAAQEIPVYLDVDAQGNTFAWVVKLPAVPEKVNPGEWGKDDLFRITFETTPPSPPFKFRTPQSDGVRFRLAGIPPETLSYSVERSNDNGNTWQPLNDAPKRWTLTNGRGTVTLFRKGGAANSRWAAFSGTTGRLLPLNAEVGVNESVLIAMNYSLTWCPMGVKIDHKPNPPAEDAWRVLRVHASACNEHSAEWFRQFHLNLTSITTRFFPVWPPSVSSPNVRHHRNSQMFFLLHGVQSNVHLWPPINGWTTPSSLGNTDGQTNSALVEINSNQTFCTLVADRQGTLLHSEFLWKHSELKFQRPEDRVRVVDAATCTVITDDALLPLSCSSIRVESPAFDGFIAINKNDGTESVYTFKAVKEGETNSTEVNNLSAGDTVSIYYGKDCVWTRKITAPPPQLPSPPPQPLRNDPPIQPSPPPAEPQENPTPQPISPLVETLVSPMYKPRNPRRSGVRVPFSHAMGCVLHQLPDAEKWKPTLLVAVRQGWMDAELFSKLKQELS